MHKSLQHRDLIVQNMAYSHCSLAERIFHAEEDLIIENENGDIQYAEQNNQPTNILIPLQQHLLSIFCTCSK